MFRLRLLHVGIYVSAFKSFENRSRSLSSTPGQTSVGLAQFRQKVYMARFRPKVYWRCQVVVSTRILKRRTAVFTSNMAPISAKLCQNAFQTIPVKSIFGRIFFFRRNFLASDDIFHLFGLVLEAGQANGPQNRNPRIFSL